MEDQKAARPSPPPLVVPKLFTTEFHVAPQDIEPGEGGSTQETRAVVLITHDTLEKCIRDALANIEADGDITQAPRMIRIEEL